MRIIGVGLVLLTAACASTSPDKFARDSDDCRAQVAQVGSDVAKQMVGFTCMAHKGDFVLPYSR